MNSGINYIDIHTHSLKKSEVIQIYNQPLEEEINTKRCSAGIHPWYIDIENTKTQLEKLEAHLQNEKTIALGECGLDKLIDLPLSEQETIFKKQVLLSQKYNKPLIVHCVKAFEDLLRIRKEMNVTVPMIIHGFNNSKEIALQLLKSGCYISFGKALLNENSNAASIISLIPPDKLFLETDNSDFTIERIYEKAGGILNIEVDQLKKIISTNFKNVFLHS